VQSSREQVSLPRIRAIAHFLGSWGIKTPSDAPGMIVMYRDIDLLQNFATNPFRSKIGTNHWNE
jgi:hypothetical protein